MSDSEGSSHEVATEKKRSKGQKRSKADSTKRKAKRPKKDKNAPKRAKTAFIIFSSEMRPDLKRKHPEYGFSELGKELAKLWRAVSEEEKKRFEQLAAEDKQRYDREKRTYEQTKGKDESSSSSKKERKDSKKSKSKSKKSKKDSKVSATLPRRMLRRALEISSMALPLSRVF
jgi:hypothetical protein